MTLSQHSLSAQSARRSVDSGRPLGLISLTGAVMTSMLGGGIFNLPQNMAEGANLGAVLLAWLITFAGMCTLANTFRLLARLKPDLNTGIYAYAHAGFGPLAGFETAWGYWLSAVFGNVAFAVLISQTLGYFFPALRNHALYSIACSTALIWIMHFIVLSGVKKALLLNLMSNAINLLMILIALVLMARAVNLERLTSDLWGAHAHMGSVLTQIKSTMPVTLWVFIGVEGAAMLAGRAENPAHIGAATLIGLAVCTVLYVLMSVLPFGLMTQPELAQLRAPSSASVLQHTLGSGGITWVMASLLVTLLNCWLMWTILVSELPLNAAKNGVLPRFLARQNRFGAPASALWLSSGLMQMILFVAYSAEDIWRWLISMTSVMILPSYLASAAYLWRSALRPCAEVGGRHRAAQLSGALGVGYSIWLLYAAGLKFVLMSTVLFMLGLPFYVYTQRVHADGRAVGS